MISMNLHQAAAITGATLIGKPYQFKGICTDSRMDCNGKLFIGLQGDNFKGEDYCHQAIENGAKAVLVNSAQDVSVTQLICEDSLKALSILAKNWTKQCKVKVIAITGSNGKTTVKNMIESIISISNQCSATKGNLNNEIGVPLTLCQIGINDEYAIVEMGAAKLGDISWLISLVDIHTAALTNVSPAHIGRFGSFENIVKEKNQIFSTLSNANFAVMPIENPEFNNWKLNSKTNILSFGYNNNTDIEILSKKEFNLQLNNSLIKNINLPALGKHNQLNAACAAAIALSLGIGNDDIKTGLENFTPAFGRLENLGEHNGSIIINDSYNANPMSVKAAIDVLANYDTITTLIIGDMAELGDESITLHQEIGKYAKKQNISNLLSIGKDSKQTSLVFSENPQHFETIEQLKTYLLKNWQQFGTILVKGSRSMHLEDLIKHLTCSEKVA